MARRSHSSASTARLASSMASITWGSRSTSAFRACCTSNSSATICCNTAAGFALETSGDPSVACGVAALSWGIVIVVPLTRAAISAVLLELELGAPQPASNHTDTRAIKEQPGEYQLMEIIPGCLEPLSAQAPGE